VLVITVPHADFVAGRHLAPDHREGDRAETW
jgi:hypothetical protein